MRKSMVLTIVFVLICLAITACGNNSVNGETDEVYTIQIGSISTEGIPEVRACYKFGEYVEDKSDGRIKVEVFHSGALGGDRQMAEAVNLGTLDMVITATSVLTAYEPQFGILDMPFAFTTLDEAFSAVDGELGDYLTEALEEKTNMVNLGFMFNGIRHVINDTRPINEPSDMEGLKIRVLESPVYISMFEALGANPTPMNFNEVYTALQQKTIDGFECSANYVYEMNFYEIQKYFSRTGHITFFACAAINKDKYESFPNDLREIVDEAAKLYLVDYERQLCIDEDADFVAKLEEVGMEVNEITQENHQKFLDAVAPMYESYEEKLGTPIFDLLRKHQ